MRNVEGMMTRDGRQDWETPPEIFAPLHAEFGFDLDVCATAANAKAPSYFSADALERRWTGTCWMNPPYGPRLGQWVRKAYESSQQGATVVCLVPARTDTRWWHEYVVGKAEVRFVRGRVKFLGAPYNAPFPSVVLVYRPETTEMAA